MMSVVIHVALSIPCSELDEHDEVGDEEAGGRGQRGHVQVEDVLGTDGTLAREDRREGVHPTPLLGAHLAPVRVDQLQQIPPVSHVL